MSVLADPSLDQAMTAAAAIACVGIAWEVMELQVGRAELLGRFFEWPVVRSRYYILLRHRGLAAWFDATLSGRTFTTLVWLHGIAAVAFPFVFVQSHRLAAVLAAVVLLGHLSVHLRLLVGMDGADQMQTVIWVGLFVYSLDLGSVPERAAALFICAQVLLSYLVAGVAKLVSPVWRSGAAVARISRASTYTSPGVARLLRVPAVSFVACWATIGFEILGPGLLVGGRPGIVVLIGLGCLFHVGIAVSMGLTTFVFAFLAAYPVLYQQVSW